MKYQINDITHRAEVIWILRTIKENPSYNSNKNIKQIFLKMFEGFPYLDLIPNNFFCGAIKTRYIIEHKIAQQQNSK